MKTKQGIIEISKLKPYDKNPRKHNDIQIQEMQKSLEMFGQFRQVVIDEKNTILAGHCIIIALKNLGKTQADFVQYKGLTENQKTKLVLADNKIAELGYTDYAEVENLIQDMGDFEIPGFDPITLKEMCSELDETLSKYGTQSYSNITPLESGNDFFAESTTTPAEPQSKPAETQDQTTEQVIVKRVTCPECGKVIVI